MHAMEADEIRAATIKLGEFEVAWGSENQLMAIKGVATFAQFTALLAKLNGRTQPAPSNGATNKPVAKVEASLHVEQKPAEPAPTPPPAETNGAAEPEDYSVFLRLTKLGDIVTEVMKRGAADFAAIRGYIGKLRDAEACPALDRIEKQGDFDGRLRTHCASRQIAGAL